MLTYNFKCMRTLFYTFFLWIIANVVWGQKGPPESGMPIVEGKCFAKGLVQPKSSIEYEIVNAYTGNNVDQDGVVILKIEVEERGHEWVKVKADRKCLSSNPEDCLVWCLKELPSVFKDFYHVEDTFAIREFETLVVPILWYEENGRSEWVEVLCKEDITDAFVKDLRLALYSIGYDIKHLESTVFDDHLNSILIKFQKENHLVFGQLTIETLDTLGVAY